MGNCCSRRQPSQEVDLVSSGNLSNNGLICSNCSKYGAQCYAKTTASRKPSRPAKSLDRRSLPPRPPTICQVCWEGPFAAHLGLFAPRIPLPDLHKNAWCTDGYSYSTSWAELRSRADAGCTWCRFLFEMRTGSDMPSGRAEGPLKITVGESIDWHYPLRGVSPRTTQQLQVRINGDRAFEGLVYTPADDHAAPHIVARNRVLDVGSPNVIDLAKVCINDCENNHDNCKAILGGPERSLPTRLIDCTDPDQPRLFHTGHTPGKYLALSYVWGEPQPYRTVLANVSAYESAMDPSMLSQTIRDAMHVTRTLGFQYLWVDALCIIQDSDEDKAHELARMHRVYRDASLTIIASSARKVSEGFLQDRATLSTLDESGVFSHDVDFPFTCPHRSASSSGDAGRPELSKLCISPIYACNNDRGGDWAYDYTVEPISSRGWCMQEYFMSARALVFASHTLQFKCQTETRNVGGAFHNGYTPRLPDGFFQLGGTSALSAVERREMYRMWLSVVMDYSTRTISYPSDKLVACGAIAQEFHAILRSDYLAGLWRATLFSDLLWYHENVASTPGARAAAYRAPSWSWAAIDGRIQLPAISMQPTAEAGNEGVAVMEVVRCQVTLENPALPFGQVTAASLFVRVPLVRCVLRKRGWAYSIWLHRAWRSDHPEDDSDDADVDTQNIGDAYLDSVEDEAHPRMWAALLSRHFGFDQIEGLIVVQQPESSGAAESESAGRKVYRRVGYFIFECPPYGRSDLIRAMGMDTKLPKAVEVELV